jgi:hypothetical protein
MLDWEKIKAYFAILVLFVLMIIMFVSDLSRDKSPEGIIETEIRNSEKLLSLPFQTEAQRQVISQTLLNLQQLKQLRQQGTEK